MNPIIELRDVSMAYQSVRGGRVDALSGVNLSVREGEFVSLLGPSGCGKTTLLNITGGLVRRTSGSVEVDGRSVEGPVPDLVSFVFQEPTLLPWRTVAKNVEFPLEVRGIPKKERVATSSKYLELVGINEFSNHYSHELSGGMKQRVAVARALALETPIVLMDEPFGALDEQSRIILGDELARIRAKTHKTILFVTHSTEEAIYLSDRVAIMTRRPATIAEIVDVSFEGPRDPAIRSTPEFAKLKGFLWKFLENQVEHAKMRPG